MAKSTGRYLGPIAALLAVVTSIVAPTPGVSGAPIGGLRATVDGRPIPLAEVSSLHCHDLAYPLIRCFHDEPSMQADEQQAAATAPAGPAITVWVTWYRDAGYGSPSFDAASSWPDLATINWRNQISAFRSYSGANPRWFFYPNYAGGASVSWGANAQISYVGATYNDRFASVMALGANPLRRSGSHGHNRHREGRELAQTGAARITAEGIPTSASAVSVWSLGAGEYLVAQQMPTNFSTSTTQNPDGSAKVEVQFEVRATAGTPGAGTLATAATSSPSWAWLNQGCFARFSNTWGWLDSCYVLHKLVGESDPRDFYQLEQYGTVAANNNSGKIYNAWLQGQKAANSSAMSWIDWSPRGSVSGAWQGIGISVSALGVGISTGSIMCEHWNITKWAEAGHFQNQWDCGCIYPFGQPYPNSREIDYMQAVSVPNGGVASWTLSEGFQAQL